MALVKRVFKLILTTDGDLSTVFPDGDDGSASLPLSWSQPADILQVQQGTTPSFSIRQYLREPSPGAATISLDQVPVGWQFDGTNLNYQGAIGVGLTTTVRPTAVFSGHTVVCPFTFAVQVIPSQSLDTTAPTKPLGFKLSPDPQGILVSFFASSDPAVGTTEASGSVQYELTIDDTSLVVIPATTGGITPKLVGSDVGAVGAVGNTLQVNNDYTITSSGVGLGGTADAFQLASMPVSGDFKLSAYVESVNGAVNANTQVILQARESLDPGARAMIARLNPTGGRMRGRGAVNAGTTTVGNLDGPTWPGYITLERKGDTWTFAYSTDGNSFTQIASGTLALPAQLYVGLALGVGDVGTCVAVLRNVSVQNLPSVSYLHQIADGRVHTYKLKARDKALNPSADTVVLTATAPDAPDTVAPTVPAIASVVAAGVDKLAVSWSASADAQSGVDGYFLQIANTDNGTFVDEPTPAAMIAGTTYTKSGLTASTTRSFRVRAKDKANNFSDYSAVVHGTTASAPPADLVPPSVPGNSRGTPISSTQILIEFDASTDNVGVAGYRLWVATASVGPFQLDPAVITASPYTWTGGLPDTPYWFQLDAFDTKTPTPNISARTAIFTARTQPSNLIVKDLHYDDFQGAYDAGKSSQPGGAQKRWQINDDYDFSTNPILDMSANRGRVGPKSARAQLDITNASGTQWFHSSATETPFRNEWNASNGAPWAPTGWNRKSFLFTQANQLEYWNGLSIYLPAPGDSFGDPAYPLNSAHPSFAIVSQWHGSGEDGSDIRNPMMALSVSGIDPATGFKNRWHLSSLVQKTFDSKVKTYDWSPSYDLGPIAPDQGKWTDWVFRCRWDYNFTGDPETSQTSKGIIQVWKNDVNILNKINQPNAFNNTQVGYPIPIGWYIERVNWSSTNPNLTTPSKVPGMPPRLVAYWGWWKYVSVVGNPQAAVDSSNVGYQRVKPPGTRPA